MHKIKRKIESLKVVFCIFLMLVISASNVNAVITIDETSLTTDDSTFKFDFDDNWINIGNMTVDNVSAGNVTVSGDFIGGNVANWDTAHGWGDHSLIGYLTSLGDPWFNASDAFGFTWTIANGWNASNVTLIRNSNGKAWIATASNLQTAIWDLNGTGGTVWIPATTITGIDNISIDNDAISIVGSSWRSRFYEDDVRLVADAGCVTQMFYVHRNETSFENIYFYGTEPSGNDEDCIKITDSSYSCHIKGCSFNKFNGTAINVTGGGTHQIERCRGMNIGDNFIRMLGTDSDISFCDATASDDVFYIHNTPNRLTGCNAFTSDNGHGFYIHTSGDGTVISSCRANDNAKSGIKGYSADGMVINNCRIDDNGEKGIYLDSCDNSVVSNNYVVESDEEGIKLSSGADNCVIDSNIIEDSGEDASISNIYETGIFITDGDNNTIIGNRCSGAKYGIYEDYFLHSPEDTIIGNNVEGNDVASYATDETDGRTNSIIKENKGYDYNSLFPYYAQATAPTMLANTTAYWYNTTSTHFYTVSNTHGTQYYLNWTTTI